MECQVWLLAAPIHSGCAEHGEVKEDDLDG